MQQIADRLWIFNGEAVPFFTLPYTTRMTVIRLSCGSLWVHSPIRLNEALKQQIDQLGTVRYLIAPNQLHHLFLPDWLQQYPQAQLFGTQGVQDKRPDIRFDGLLTADFSAPWQDEIQQLLFTGSAVMEEAVFFHKASKILIVTDLIENFAPQSFTPLKRLLAKAAGILAPNGKMPADWRLSFLFHKAEARVHMQRIIGWQPEKISMAHGLIIEKDAVAFLHRSFSWLNLKQEDVQ